jgi:MerR family transcriptional regulator/heat shock protein HspR
LAQRRVSRPLGALDAGFDLDKPLYTISVASEILETHPRTLMLYEDVGLVEPFRTSTNRRRYSQRDIRKLQVIQHLTREKGVNLAGVRHILALFEVLKKRGLVPPSDLRDVFERYTEIV